MATRSYAVISTFVLFHLVGNLAFENLSKAETHLGNSSGTSKRSAAKRSASATLIPAFEHVFLLVEENLSYEQVIGHHDMPYLNQLAQRYGLATQYYAVTHPSIGNYFSLTTGQILTNDDYFSGSVATDNLVRHLLLNQKEWKSYAESIPYTGYIGQGDGVFYIRRHNPFSFFTDVVNDVSQRNNLVPFTQLQEDLDQWHLPDFGFIVPDGVSDGHDEIFGWPARQIIDRWLIRNIDPLIQNPEFQNNSILFIVFDEGKKQDIALGGGHVAMIAVSSKVRPEFQSSQIYQHPNLLKTICQALRLNSCPKAVAQTAEMLDFF